MLAITADIVDYMLKMCF